MGKGKFMDLCMIIPCYNEHEILWDSSEKLKEKLRNMMHKGKLGSSSSICFVDDGSKDDTWDIITKLCSQDKIFSGLRLAHNVGHQNAILAGMMEMRNSFDAVITMDADLQDDIEAVEEMVDQVSLGCNIVYGVRKSRSTDTFFKRVTAEGFYRIMRFLGARIIFNHADFRLLDKAALEALSGFHERNLFLRGIVPMIGLRHGTVYYERKERLAGESKYPLKKMISFAWQGVTSLSPGPIQLVMSMGCVISLVSLIMMIWSVLRYLDGDTIVGWASIAVSIWFIGGLLLFSIGIVGEYIGKIYLEIKARPRYIIEEKLQDR